MFGSGQHAPHGHCGSQSTDTMQVIRDVDCLLQAETVQIKTLQLRKQHGQGHADNQ